MSGALELISPLTQRLAHHQSHKLVSRKFHFVLVKLINSLKHTQPGKQPIHCLQQGDFSSLVLRGKLVEWHISFLPGWTGRSVVGQGPE